MSRQQDEHGLSRRGLLRRATLIAGGAAIVAGSLVPAAAQTENAPSGKMSQKAAEYQPSPKAGQKCLDCSLFVQPQACKLVDGTISPVGWCKFFAKKAS